MNRWQGSLVLGWCQITYHPSYLKKGRTSVLSLSPSPYHPPPPISAQITEPRVPLGICCDAHAKPHLHWWCLESSQTITSTMEAFPSHIFYWNTTFYKLKIFYTVTCSSLTWVVQYIFHLPRLVRSAEQLKPSVNKACGYIRYCKGPQRTPHEDTGFGKI